MDSNQTDIDTEIFDRFLPLKLVPPSLRGELLKHAMMVSFDVCRNIVKHNNKSSVSHYLVDGLAEVRYSFYHRVNIPCNGDKCSYPLEEQILEGGVVRAVTPCQVLIVNRDHLDAIIARLEAGSINGPVVQIIDDARSLDHAKIDDDYESDWMALFYQSPLAINLSAKKLQQVFSSLTSVAVNGGETIVKCHTQADFFYIIEKGYAEVITESSGPFKGKRFELEPGDYFGDESIVAQTIRNASVIMTSDGLLGRMEMSVFNNLIKPSLVIKPSVNELLELSNPIYCDVRLPLEYKLEHLPFSMNVPVGRIRKNLSLFDKNRVYVITPEGGHRSELAAYIMMQSGIETYCMDAKLCRALASQQARQVNTKVG